MATGERIAQVLPKDLIPGGTPLFNQVPLYVSGISGGAPLPKADSNTYSYIFRVPTTGTPLSTGLTFDFYLVDDTANPGAGLVVRLGVTVKRLVSGTSDLTTTSAATEVAASHTMPSTAGVVYKAAFAIANAALPASLAAGDLVLVQFRRIGSNTADTHQGQILLVCATVTDT